MRHLIGGKTGVAVAMVVAASFAAPAAAQAPVAGPGPTGPTSTEPEHLLVTGPSGADLGAHPTVRAGTILTVTVRGFAARAHVEIRLAGQAALPYRPPADADGVLRFLYRVPDDLTAGGHRLLFSGQPAGPASSGQPGNIVVSVPNIAVVAFEVLGRS